jgi:cell division protein ZapE
MGAREAAPAASGAAGASVLERYRQQLAERRLEEDAAQLAVCAKLDTLRERLRIERWLGLLGLAAARPPPRGLYLSGGVGRGKTFLMDLFCASLPPEIARRVHFHRFMYGVHAQLARLDRRRSPLEHIARSLARETRVLCFDELYVADIADAMILGALFAGLFRRGVTLVATSNVPPAELYQEGLQRSRFLPAIELLERHLEVVRIGGATDYRLRQLTQAGIYFEAGAPDTATRLGALFSCLADGHPQAGGTIEIEGRPIAVVRAGGAVVWFEFAALCATARSQNDYIEIARVPVGDRHRRAGPRCRARRRGAPLHRARRRALRPQRQPHRLGGGPGGGALPRRAAASAVRAHREPSRRDAERGVPRARAQAVSAAQGATSPLAPWARRIS